MQETILAFQEVDEDFAGYRIFTTQQIIELQISNYQSCCERWGYFMSEENLDFFVGSHLIDICITDEKLNKRLAEKMEDEYYLDAGGMIFVDLLTDKGTLQFVAYNAHNGYYGHEAKVVSRQLEYSVCL